jgi:hypothetical protein
MHAKQKRKKKNMKVARAHLKISLVTPKIRGATGIKSSCSRPIFFLNRKECNAPYNFIPLIDIL